MKPFVFTPGQFLSVQIPGYLKKAIGAKRCYSFALNPVLSKKQGYEVCVKLVEGGTGSQYLRTLRMGDRFTAKGPYGDFKLRTHSPRRNLCLISTGTGISPFRSMLGSHELIACRYQNIILLHGVRREEELVFVSDFQRAGVESHFIVSRPGALWAGRKGRVNLLLKDFVRKYNVSDTDFYVCGNGDMVSDIFDALTLVYRVDPKAVVRENFSSKKKKAA